MNVTSVNIAQELSNYCPTPEKAYALLSRLDQINLSKLPSFESVPAIGYWQRVVNEVEQQGSDSLRYLLSEAAKEFPDSELFNRYRAEKTVTEPQKGEEFVIVLNGTIDEVDAQRLQAIVDHLRQITGDVSLTLKNIEKGSIRLTLDGDDKVSRLMQSLYERGQLREVDGLPVLSLEIVDNDGKKSNLESGKDQEENAPCQKLIQLFISYAHEDEELRQAMEAHLSVLKRQGVLSVWTDRAIVAGEEWEGLIDKNLESADIILLLVSAYFVASDYCYAREMQRALELHKSGNAAVIPVIARPVDWSSTPFSKLTVLPTNAQPVTSWSDEHAAWTNIATGIRRTIERLVE